MVGEVGPSAEDVVAQRLREGVPLRQARGLADEQVKGGGVVLEHRAVRALPLRARALGVALRMGRLGDFTAMP